MSTQTNTEAVQIIESNLHGKTTKHATPGDQIWLWRTLRETGHFFTAVFIKRTNGHIRQMHCRFGVKKNVKGVGLRYDPVEKGTLIVWDRQRLDFRSINTKDLLLVSYRGVVYQF